MIEDAAIPFAAQTSMLRKARPVSLIHAMSGFLQRLVSLGVKGAFAAALPEYPHGVAIVASYLCREFEQGAVKRGAIVVGKFDEACFLDEAAKLDQVAGARPSLHDPSPRIATPLPGFSPARRLRQPRVC